MADDVASVWPLRVIRETVGGAEYRGTVRPVIFLLLGALAFSLSATPADVERLVEEAVATPLRESRFSGVVLVRHEGRTLVRKAYGRADHATGRLNTPATGFMIMSVSKQFTAALILRLVAQGRLGLRDRVSDYLTGWPSEWDAVTVHDLLSHSAGTDIDTTYFWLVEHHPQYWPDPSGSPPAYEPRPLITEPGTTFLYSNVGYTLLSLLAANAGGKPFDELMREEVFCPLGMTDTQPERGPVVAGRARGHRLSGEGIERSEQSTIDIAGAGDLVSTADDLARLDEGLDDDRFLPSALRAVMFTAHPRQKKWPAGWGALLRSSEIGYGWFLRTMSDGTPMRFHTGSGAGFRALNFHIPQSGLVIVVLNNIGADGASWIPDLVERIHAAIAAKEKE